MTQQKVLRRTRPNASCPTKRCKQFHQGFWWRLQMPLFSNRLSMSSRLRRSIPFHRLTFPASPSPSMSLSSTILQWLMNMRRSRKIWNERWKCWKRKFSHWQNCANLLTRGWTNVVASDAPKSLLHLHRPPRHLPPVDFCFTREKDVDFWKEKRWKKCPSGDVIEQSFPFSTLTSHFIWFLNSSETRFGSGLQRLHSVGALNGRRKNKN